ncbi:sigma-70 family RNA polymerase sigma factor [Nocardioides sp. GY 10127]|uniref:RNA polymerase sigma factor n=1 Tax=Nocardioides sp. GY 10127 TaxID=2569762 RepID=UPI0010A8D79F|nr:sigma-70 family RNA polymerase sigma factor [Nocardioides sp. GY 10127]TIC82909.1 sigma-70 family RNA polymerase sigma factor [Nocardioides sp. GY 10127]
MTDAPTPDEVDELARRAAGGDAAALEELLAAVRPRAMAACRGVLPHPADAEDACQDALLNVATRLGQWRGNGRFTTWMHAVCVNSARSTYRRLSRQARPVDPHDHASSDRPDPRTTSVVAGTRLDLLDAMETLEREHPQLVQPLLLRDVYDLPYDEIAALLDLPLGTVKAQIHTGRRLTRPLLRDLA